MLDASGIGGETCTPGHGPSRYVGEQNDPKSFHSRGESVADMSVREDALEGRVSFDTLLPR